MLEIKNLSVSLDGKALLHDVNMTVARGARHLLAGSNGSGKSTLAAVIAGNPMYQIDSGEIIFDGRDITHENATTRALLSFLKHSVAAHAHFQTGRDLSMGEFLQTLERVRTELNIPKEWLNRSINVGFSGGERKRLMLLRLKMIAPAFAILDEPDSGADADTQKLIAQTIHEMPDTTFMFISHQPTFTSMVGASDITTLSGGHIMVK